MDNWKAIIIGACIVSLSLMISIILVGYFISDEMRYEAVATDKRVFIVDKEEGNYLKAKRKRREKKK